MQWQRKALFPNPYPKALLFPFSLRSGPLPRVELVSEPQPAQVTRSSGPTGHIHNLLPGCCCRSNCLLLSLLVMEGQQVAAVVVVAVAALILDQPYSPCQWCQSKQAEFEKLSFVACLWLYFIESRSKRAKSVTKSCLVASLLLMKGNVGGTQVHTLCNAV